jgi:hypothetical protein
MSPSREWARHPGRVAVLSPVLTPGDLPLPELAAARLDGELYALGGSDCPVDEVERPALRARAVLAQRPARLIAELGTAAWVWGATPVEPAVLEFCVDLSARARPAAAPRVVVREIVLDPEDLVEFDGVRVTAPLRTAVDLARFRAGFGEGEVALVRALASIGRFGLGECVTLMDRRRNLPAKRRAAERLTWALAPPVESPQAYRDPVSRR